MPSASRRFQLSVLIVVMAIAWCQPQTASAWWGRWHRGFCGVGFRPWCGPVFGPRFYGGWGGWYGGPRFAYYDSVAFGGPYGGFFSGAVSSYVIGPRWCVPGVSYGFPCTYYPYPIGYGCWGGSPIVVSPYGGSIAPVYGPAGILPFMGLSTTVSTAPFQSLAAGGSTPPPMTRLARRAAAAGVAVAPPAPQLAVGRPTPTVPASTTVVRASNGVARLRAAKLVVIGDRHLREAVHTPAKLSAALDAYRRSATIAPDLADTFLRQAIVLTALERDEDAAKAVDRAVAIDARLDIGRNAGVGNHVPAGVAASEQSRLPPDPVFGERPDRGPTTLASRTASLMDRIFREEPAAAHAGANAGIAEDGDRDTVNWIAARWSRQWQGRFNAVAAR